MVLILEDNSERVRRFKRVLAEVAPGLLLRVWRDAHAMTREMMPLLPTATLISLDHDLESIAPGEDPGDGLDVARALVAQPMRRPVIIHSSNAIRADQMSGEFELGRWSFWRVLPLGDDWIETDWRIVAEDALRHAR